jgi:hypothetical protein
MYEVYRQEKPAVPFRALLAAALILLVTLLLAYGLVRSRRALLHDQRVEPAGWSISFQPPSRFAVGSPPPTGLNQVMLYQGTEGPWPVSITLGGFEFDEGYDVQRIAEVVWGYQDGRGIPEVRRVTLGSGPAYEIGGAPIGMLIRFLMPQAREMYFVAITTGGPQLSPAMVRRFDAVSESIRVERVADDGADQPGERTIHAP